MTDWLLKTISSKTLTQRNLKILWNLTVHVWKKLSASSRSDEIPESSKAWLATNCKVQKDFSKLSIIKEFQGRIVKKILNFLSILAIKYITESLPFEETIWVYEDKNYREKKYFRDAGGISLSDNIAIFLKFVMFVLDLVAFKNSPLCDLSLY